MTCKELFFTGADHQAANYCGLPKGHDGLHRGLETDLWRYYYLGFIPSKGVSSGKPPPHFIWRYIGKWKRVNREGRRGGGMADLGRKPLLSGSDKNGGGA